MVCSIVIATCKQLAVFQVWYPSTPAQASPYQGQDHVHCHFVWCKL